MKDDAELLRDYAEDHSEEAFAELVRRHLGLVYSGALRRVGHDAHFAEDVAQKVFRDLARKAASLAGHMSIAGWLYVSTQAAAAELVRNERRRKARETEAVTMEKILSSSPTEPEADWSRIRPLLDDVILGLKEDDREAVVLRYYEQRPFAEIGSALHLTEDAARKRVDRAVEKLRARLIERGVSSTTGAIAFALAEQAASAAPATLAAKIAGAAVAEATAAGAGTSLLVSIMSALSSKTAAVSVVLLAILAALLWKHRTQAGLQAELTRLAGQAQELQGLQRENQRLARTAAAAEDLRSAVAALPSPPPDRPPAAAPKPVIPVQVVITPTGQIVWDGTPIRLDEFVALARDFSARHPGAEAQVSVVGQAGSSFSQATFVTDELRKAEMKAITVDSAARPGAVENWFPSPSPKLPAAPPVP
ncbi:MAG TPA: sigma-70 family RNA polymerase sigma factor [Opitutaceae bacterium]|nr:sigma-70 family RNA polymerase sigma factor [Opitutaceae bacterium]